MTVAAVDDEDYYFDAASFDGGAASVAVVADEAHIASARAVFALVSGSDDLAHC